MLPYIVWKGRKIRQKLFIPLICSVDLKAFKLQNSASAYVICGVTLKAVPGAFQQCTKTPAFRRLDAVIDVSGKLKVEQ